MEINMLCRTLLASILSLACLTTWAQPGGMHPEGNDNVRGERLETFRIAYLTQELNLSTEEAQKFWPLFNESEDIKKVLDQERREILDDLMEGSNHKAHEVESALERVRVIEVDLAAGRLAFAKLLIANFDADMAVDFIESHKGFRHAMLDAVRRRGKEKSGPGGHRPGRGQR
jgi:hypothetical protein